MHDRAAWHRGGRICIGMLLAIMVVFSMCSCGTSEKTKKVDIPPADTANREVQQTGEPSKAAAVKKDPPDQGSSMAVHAALLNCSSSSSLPAGFSRDDDPYYSEYIDDVGKVCEGSTFVQVGLEFTNINDSDCRLNLGNYRMCAFSSDAPGFSQSAPPWWVLNGDRKDKYYFMPALSANASASYVLGYIVPNEILNSGDVEVLLSSDQVGLETKNIRTIDITSLVDSSSEDNSYDH